MKTTQNGYTGTQHGEYNNGYDKPSGAGYENGYPYEKSKATPKKSRYDRPKGGYRRSAKALGLVLTVSLALGSHALAHVSTRPQAATFEQHAMSSFVAPSFEPTTQFAFATPVQNFEFFTPTTDTNAFVRFDATRHFAHALEFVAAKHADFHFLAHAKIAGFVFEHATTSAVTA